MNEPDRNQDQDQNRDQRSDLQRAVEARSDAVARGEGGDDSAEADTPAGENGAGGVVKNQDDMAQ